MKTSSTEITSFYTRCNTYAICWCYLYENFRLNKLNNTFWKLFLQRAKDMPLTAMKEVIGCNVFPSIFIGKSKNGLIVKLDSAVDK